MGLFLFFVQFTIPPLDEFLISSHFPKRLFPSTIGMCSKVVVKALLIPIFRIPNLLMLDIINFDQIPLLFCIVLGS